MKKLLSLAFLIVAVPAHAFVQTIECHARPHNDIATDSDIIVSAIALHTKSEFQPAGGLCNAIHHTTYIVRGVGSGDIKAGAKIKVTKSAGVIDHACPESSGKAYENPNPTLEYLFLQKKDGYYIPTPDTQCP